MTDVPEPRTPGRYRVAVVCLGNICRSPMADVVLNARVVDAGLGGPGGPGAAAGAERLRSFRDFDPEGPGDVPDPYFGGHEGFRDVLAMVERTSAALMDRIRAVVGS